MSSGYRLAPALAARLVGLVLMLLAVVVFVATVLVAVLDGPPEALLAVGAAAVVAGLGVMAALRTVRVVELDDEGYRVRMVRGAGVHAASWREVRDAGAASPHGVDCVVLRLRDGRSTSIPLAAVDAPGGELVADLRAHLRRGDARPPR